MDFPRWKGRQSHSQYHGYRGHGDARCQGVCGHDIDFSRNISISAIKSFVFIFNFSVRFAYRKQHEWRHGHDRYHHHYSDVMMRAMASQITGVSIVYSIVCLCADLRKYQSSASLAFLGGIHRWPVNSPRKGPVTRKMFPFDDVIMVAHHVVPRFKAIKHGGSHTAFNYCGHNNQYDSWNK